MWKRFPMSRKLLLLIGDIALLFLAAHVAITFFLPKETLAVSSSLYYGMVPVMVVTSGILFNVNGLFSLEKKRYAEILLSLAVAMMNLLIIMMAFSFFVREFSYSRSVLIATIVLQFIAISFWRYIFWRFERSRLQIRRMMIIGAKEECSRVFNRLKMLPALGVELKYVCTEVENKDWMRVVGEVDLIVVCSDLALKDKAEIVHFCNENKKQVMLIPDVYELFCSGAELDKIDDIPVFRPQSLVPTLEQRSLKRILDISIAGIAFLGVLPLMLLTAAAIKIFDPGSVLFSQIRTGRFEKEFKVYKFRTMRVDAEKYSGPVLASENDPRITKLGRFLRATRLDELPQIWNVVIGDMSLVGPRPERPFFVEQFKREIPEYAYRHNVKPGITGMAQVYGKYNTTPYDKLIYDLMYIQKCNMVNDLVIMTQTLRVLVTKSATEGAGVNKKNVDLGEYKIGNVYGDF